MATVYKLCRVEDTEDGEILTSLFHWRNINNEPGFAVKYKEGEFTKPIIKGSGLYAFITEKEARNYSGDFIYTGRFRLYEAYVPKIKNVSRLLSDVFPLTIARLKEDKKMLIKVPPGTVSCSSIRLVRRLD